MVIQPDGTIKELGLVQDRSCGDCRLCCKLLLVEAPDEDFLKPQGKWCEHACDSGCAIYADRPKACAKFICQWLNGSFAERDRPDRAHLVICLEESVGERMLDRDGKVVAENVPVWCVYEDWPGAASKPRAQKIIAEVQQLLVRRKAEPDKWAGPFPVLIIPSTTGLRRLKFPGSDRWLPCLRPHETEAQFGLDRLPRERMA